MHRRPLLYSLILVLAIVHWAGNAQVASAREQTSTLHAAVTPTTTGALRWHDRGPVQGRYFATITNDSDEIAENCRISLTSDVPLELDYYARHPLTNEFIGPDNVPLGIPARGKGTFGFTLKLPEDRYFPRQRLSFDYVCDNRLPARTVKNVNDVRLGGGTEPSPSILMKLKHEGLPGILRLSSEVAGEPCLRFSPGDQQLAPCATGEFVLALKNLEPEPVTVTIDVARDDNSRVQDSWICRTDDTGSCMGAWHRNTQLRPILEADEAVTFAIRLLTFDDYRLHPPGFWRRVMIPVVAKGERHGVPMRVDGYDLLQLRARSFEWAAERIGGVVQVRGSILLSDDCERANLGIKPSTESDPQLLQLELHVSEPSDSQRCTPGLKKHLLSLADVNTEATAVWVHTIRGILKFAVKTEP